MTNITTFPGDCFNLGFVNKKTYTFNPTGNTSKYFIGVSYSEGMEIEIDDNGHSHGSNQRFYITRTWGAIPVLSTADVSTNKVYNFYYTEKNDRLYVWFNETLTSQGNDVIYRIRVKTIQAALGPEPAADEQYAGRTIGVNSASAFPAPTIIKRNNQVGIGTTSPQDITHIYKDGGNDPHGLLIENANSGTGQATLKFGVAQASGEGTGLSKAGIFFKRAATNGRGDLIFCMDNADDTNDVDTGNHALTIYRDGNVGIGVAAPAGLLDVRASSTDPGAKPTVHIGDNAADTGDYGMLQLVRAASAGTKCHASFIRSGNTVTGMGYYNNATNTFCVWPSFGNVNETPAFSIRSDGHVGVGTSDAACDFHIQGSSGEMLRASDGTRTFYMGCDSNDPWIGTSTNHKLRFINNGQESARFNVGSYSFNMTQSMSTMSINPQTYRLWNAYNQAPTNTNGDFYFSERGMYHYVFCFANGEDVNITHMGWMGLSANGAPQNLTVKNSSYTRVDPQGNRRVRFYTQNLPAPYNNTNYRIKLGIMMHA